VAGHLESTRRDGRQLGGDLGERALAIGLEHGPAGIEENLV